MGEKWPKKSGGKLTSKLQVQEWSSVAPPIPAMEGSAPRASRISTVAVRSAATCSGQFLCQLAPTLFRPFLAHFCSFFPRFFAVLSILPPRFRKPAPRPGKTVRNGRKTAGQKPQVDINVARSRDGQGRTNRPLRELGLGRPFLHALRLSFAHPCVAGRRVCAVAPLPEALERFLRTAGMATLADAVTAEAAQASGGGGGVAGHNESGGAVT